MGVILTRTIDGARHLGDTISRTLSPAEDKYLLTLLKGAALDWVSNLINSSDPNSHDYSAFVYKLSTRFGQSEGPTRLSNNICAVSCRITRTIGSPLAEFSFNNAINVSTGFTPFFVSSGSHPRLEYLTPSEELAPSATVKLLRCWNPETKSG